MPAKRPAPLGTLAYMAENAKQTYIVCGKCKRWTIADLQQIARTSGWNSNINDIGARLRCLRCRHRGARLTFAKPRSGT